MKILALDISTKSTGWFVNKKACGLICPFAEALLEEKLVYFRQELHKLLRKYKPDVVVIEDVYYQPRKGSIHTLKHLSKFGGVASEVSCSEGAKIEIITATAARKHCCGKREGKVTKKDVFDFFVDKYNLSNWTFEDYNDITDAWALARGYREKEKLKKKAAKTK